MLITNNKAYDVLKFIALVLLPAIGTLYFAIAQIWGLPDGSEVVGTIVAVDTGLGGLLHISSVTYNAPDGTMEVINSPDGEHKTFSLNLNGDPADLQHNDKVTFKVKHTTPMAKKVAAKRKRTTSS